VTRPEAWAEPPHNEGFIFVMQPQSNEHHHPELERMLAEQEEFLRAAFTVRVTELIREVRQLTGSEAMT
jgi:hypothetical protein